MTTIERGLILDINLEPVQGSETGKVRPCVVVTNDVYNERVPVIQINRDRAPIIGIGIMPRISRAIAVGYPHHILMC